VWGGAHAARIFTSLDVNDVPWRVVLSATTIAPMPRFAGDAVTIVAQAAERESLSAED